jgi:hypothetical protein
MAPAANPSPSGRKAEKLSTKRKAGAATRGCGRLEKTLHAAADATDAPRGTRTRLIARSSPSRSGRRAAHRHPGASDVDVLAPSQDLPGQGESARSETVRTFTSTA